MKKQILALALVWMGATTVCWAKDDSGLYLVGTVGATSNISNVDSATSLSGLIGFRFNRFFALEGGMGALAADSQYTTPQTLTVNGVSYSNLTSVTMGSTELGAVLGLPLGDNGSVFLKFGTVSSEVSYKPAPAGTELEESWKGSMTGVGAQYIIPWDIKFGAGKFNIGLRAGVNRYSLKNSDGSRSETPVSTYVGGVIKF